MTKLDVINNLASRDLALGYESLADLPHYSLFKDMEKAAERIAKAVNNGEKIGLCGDYDQDGIASYVLMVEFFEAIGAPFHKAIIPDRFSEGYGLSVKALRRLDGCELILTVDNGISCSSEVTDACREMGADLIITDHHTVPSHGIPDAYAVVNQKQADDTFPFKEISGCAVAWYVCAAVKNALGLDVKMGRWMDLLALTAISDVMPLVGPNRLFVIEGLKRINSPVLQRPFFREIMELIGKSTLTAEDLAFQCIPRQNATGRLESAILGAEALMATDVNVFERVKVITDINNFRKEIQADIAEHALNKAQGQADFIVVSGHWHEGVVGIVASKIAETFKCPAIVLSETERGELKGSGRSYGTVNIYEIIAEHKNLLLGFGGHAGACGLAVDPSNLDLFRAKVQESSRALPRHLFESTNKSMGEIHPVDTDLEFYREIETYGPFGEGNPAPVFTAKGAKVISTRVVGQDKNHTRLVIDWSGAETAIMAFNEVDRFRAGDMIEFEYSLQLNEWQGNINVQYMPIDTIRIT